MKNQHQSSRGKLSLASSCYRSGSVQMIYCTKVSIVWFEDHTPLLSFLFIAALKSSDIHPVGEGREETTSIQAIVYSLLGKCECLRQIIELVNIDLPHNILWLVASKSKLTWQHKFVLSSLQKCFCSCLQTELCAYVCAYVYNISQMLRDQRKVSH